MQGNKLMALFGDEDEEESQREFDAMMDQTLEQGDQMETAIKSMDNLNLNKALNNELEEAHDSLFKAAAADDEEEPSPGFMKTYSERISSEVK